MFKGKKEGKRGKGRRGWAALEAGRQRRRVGLSRDNRVALCWRDRDPGHRAVVPVLRVIFPRISRSASIKFKVSHLS
jgi:hypothetical protein